IRHWILESLLPSDRCHPQSLFWIPSPPGDRVWLSTRHLRLHTDSKKVTPRFVGPYPVTTQINPVAYRLRLPSSLKVHPVFHISQLKPYVSSHSFPPQPLRLLLGSSMVVPPSPSAISWTLILVAGASSILWTGRAMAPRNIPGFPPGSSWTQTSSRPSIAASLLVRDRQEPVVEGGSCQVTARKSEDWLGQEINRKSWCLLLAQTSCFIHGP
uniref:Tf2-1-like SH3-like domain-containing protein n=1 Tax=Denticeps clupeoides TaxID=299321 RepID=A0AAY4AHK4_9TELE